MVLVFTIEQMIQHMIQQIEQLLNDIYKWSEYLYEQPSLYREYHLIKPFLDDLKQRSPNLEITYRLALSLLQSARLSHRDIQIRAYQQYILNQQVIERNFRLMYPRIQTIFDTDNENVIPGLRANLEQLREQIDDFVPSDLSLSNTLYSNQLNEQVEQYASQIFSSGRESDGDCPVCLDSLTNGNALVRFIPCGHFIHHHCLMHYQRINENALCPICRSSQEWLHVPDQ